MDTMDDRPRDAYDSEIYSVSFNRHGNVSHYILIDRGVAQDADPKPVAKQQQHYGPIRKRGKGKVRRW